MKRIEAFIQPHRLSKVVHALHELPGFGGFTAYEAKGQGHIHGHGTGGHDADGEDCLVYRQHQVLIVLCDDVQADAIAHAIARAAHTGNKGDGLVSISEVTQILRSRDALLKDGGRS